MENEREKLKNIDKLLSQHTTTTNSNAIEIADKSEKISRTTTDLMSKSFNENMFYNRNKIEVSYFDFTMSSIDSTVNTESLPRNSKIAPKTTHENRKSSQSEYNNASPLTIPKYHHSLSSINHYSTDNLKSTTPPIIEGVTNGTLPSTSQQQQQQHQLQSSTPVKVQRRQSTKQKRPLTRYLPNFSLDFNLRQHIETAGHQLQLCPHVTIDGELKFPLINK